MHAVMAEVGCDNPYPFLQLTLLLVSQVEYEEQGVRKVHERRWLGLSGDSILLLVCLGSGVDLASWPGAVARASVSRYRMNIVSVKGRRSGCGR